MPTHLFFAAVAQLDSALGFYPSGCGFESHQLHKLRSPPRFVGDFIVFS